VAPEPDRYRRLPGGRHRLSREEVAESQRRRLIAAAGDVLAERRIGGLSARLIARRAGVSNYTFYEHFESVDAVLAAAFTAGARRLVNVVAGNCAEGHGAGIEGAVAAGLSLGLEDLGLAALMRLEVAVALPQVAAEREQLACKLAALADVSIRNLAVSAPTDARTLAVEAMLAHGFERLEGKESTEPADFGSELRALIR
jgi:AcrR family transcriptional regulator